MEFLGLKDEDLPGMGEKAEYPLGSIGSTRRYFASSCVSREQRVFVDDRSDYAD